MLDLERAERRIIAFLTATLLLGVGIAAYNKSRPGPDVSIGKFTVENTTADAIRYRAAASININEADVEKIMRIKGVGKVLAQRIVDYRNARGRFASKEDIKNVKGIGDALYENIKDDVSIE